jgi:hypothetical protein
MHKQGQVFSGWNIFFTPMCAPHQGMLFLRWGLLAACVLVWFGHICALPIIGHIDPVKSAQAHADAPDGESHEVHEASCSAVTAKPTADLLAAVCDVSAVLVEPTPAMDPWLPNWAWVVVGRPSLFLLHTSFLI